MTRLWAGNQRRYHVGIASVLRRCVVGAVFAFAPVSGGAAGTVASVEDFVAALDACVTFYETHDPEAFVGWEMPTPYKRACEGCTTSYGVAKHPTADIKATFNFTDRGRYIGIDCDVLAPGLGRSRRLATALDSWASAAIKAGRAEIIAAKDRRFSGEFIKFCKRQRRPAALNVRLFKDGSDFELASGKPTGMYRPVARCKRKPSNG